MIESQDGLGELGSVHRTLRLGRLGLTVVSVRVTMVGKGRALRNTGALGGGVGTSLLGPKRGRVGGLGVTIRVRGGLGVDRVTGVSLIRGLSIGGVNVMILGSGVVRMGALGIGVRGTGALAVGRLTIGVIARGVMGVGPLIRVTGVLIIGVGVGRTGVRIVGIVGVMLRVVDLLVLWSLNNCRNKFG